MRRALTISIGMTLLAAVNASPIAEATTPGTNGLIVSIRGDTYGSYYQLWDADGVPVDAPETLNTNDHYSYSSYVQPAAWSNDGTRIAAATAYNNDIYVVDYQTGEVTKLGVGGSRPDWSPNDLKIAVERANERGVSQIVVVNSDGTGATPLTTQVGGVPIEGGGETTGFRSGFAPAWSPDGTKIAFIGENYTFIGNNPNNGSPMYETRRGLYIMSSTGSNQTVVYGGGTQDSFGSPDWSPDGKKILFDTTFGSPDANTDGVGDTNHLWSLTVATNAVTQVTDGGGETDGSLSPDGKEIAFNCGINVCLMPVAGGEATQISEGCLGNFYCFAPDWGALPQTTHLRTLTLTLKQRLVATGDLSLAEGDTFTDCIDGVKVAIQRRENKKWRTQETVKTNAKGEYKANLRDQPGKYRARTGYLAFSADLHVDACPLATSNVARN